MKRRSRHWSGLAASASVCAVASLAAGCVAYHPAPLHPDAFPAAFEARKLPPAPPDGVWSAAALLDVALSRSPAVAEAAARYEAAQAAVRAAHNPPAMVLTLTTEYADESHPFGPAAALDTPLDRGGRRSGRIAQAELQALQAFYDWREAAWTVRTTLARARADLVGADEAVALADAAVALRRERADRVRRRVEAGEDDRSQQLILTADVLSAQRRADDARARRAGARLDLARALGLPGAATASVTVAAAAEPPSLADLPRWRAEATLARADVLKALVHYDLAETALRVEVAKQYPEVRVSPGVYYDHGVLKVPVNVAITLPPRDGNRAAIAQAQAARAAAAQAVYAAQAAALGAVDGAEGQLAVAQGVLARTRDTDAPGVRRAEALAERRVRLGEGDRVDQLGARAAVADAELALADARRTRRQAVAMLEEALHRTFDPAEAALLERRLTRSGPAT